MTKEQRELLTKALDQNEDYLLKLYSDEMTHNDLESYLGLLGRMSAIIVKELIRLDDEKRLAYRSTEIFNPPIVDKTNDFDK